MTPEVFIPFYGENPLRERNLLAVVMHLARGGLKGVAPDIGGQASPGAKRNAIVDWADDPIVFNDADSLCPPEQIRAAIKQAQLAPGLVFAYDLYVRLGEQASAFVCGDEFTGDFELLQVERTIVNSGSMGCVAISRASFDELGGFDESYTGWGYEDLDFARRAAERWPLRRVPGPLYHLWHGERRADDSPADSDERQVRENSKRWLASA